MLVTGFIFVYWISTVEIQYNCVQLDTSPLLQIQ